MSSKFDPTKRPFLTEADAKKIEMELHVDDDGECIVTYTINGKNREEVAMLTEHIKYLLSLKGVKAP